MVCDECSMAMSDLHYVSSRGEEREVCLRCVRDNLPYTLPQRNRFRIEGSAGVTAALD